MESGFEAELFRAITTPKSWREQQHVKDLFSLVVQFASRVTAHASVNGHYELEIYVDPAKAKQLVDQRARHETGGKCDSSPFDRMAFSGALWRDMADAIQLYPGLGEHLTIKGSGVDLHDGEVTPHLDMEPRSLCFCFDRKASLTDLMELSHQLNNAIESAQGQAR